MEEAKAKAKAARLDELDKAAEINALSATALQGIMVGRKVCGSEAFQRWKDWARVRYVSEHTVTSYSGIIQQWLTAAGRHDASISNVHMNAIDGFVNHNGGKRSTRQVRLAALQSFFGYLSAEGIILGDPSRLVNVKMSLMSFEEKESKKREPFTEAELDTVIANTHSPETRMAIILGSEYGLRLGDAVSFTWEQISPRTLVVWTDKHDRRIEMQRTELFNTMLSSLFPRDKGPLLPSFTGKSTHALSLFFSDHFRRYGVNKTFHCLRHTFATRLAKFGESVDQIREKLGHALPATTEGYIHLCS